MRAAGGAVQWSYVRAGHSAGVQQPTSPFPALSALIAPHPLRAGLRVPGRRVQLPSSFPGELPPGQ